MNESNLPNWLLSSKGEGLSMRAKAVIGGALPFALLVAGLFGYSVDPSQTTALVDTLVDVIAAAGTVVSGVFFVRGWARRNFHRANKLGKFAE